jgi:hypothetical protein
MEFWKQNKKLLIVLAVFAAYVGILLLTSQ